MNRAFVSLYIVVVLSILVVGIGADRLWQFLNTEPDVSPFQPAFFALIDAELLHISQQKNTRRVDEKYKDKTDAIEHLSKITSWNIELFNVEDIASSSLEEEIMAGNAVTIHDDSGSEFVYKYLPRSDIVVRVLFEKNSRNNQATYWLVLVGFYGVIAVLLYFWVWPLSRDLRRLKKHTETFGSDGYHPVQLSPQSTVYGLATAFNNMAQRIEDLLASNKEMTYAISHELRTPLARMKFALEMAKDAKDERQLLSQFDNLHEDVTQMDRLINEMLVYASYDQHDRTLAQRYGDLSTLVKTIISQCRITHADKSPECRLDDRLSEEQVSCDWYLMERCISNVIENAFKYSGGVIHITLEAFASHFYVSVEDDGAGIPESERSAVLNAFVRLREENSDNHHAGFGLGLAIVNRIMQWHGGEVRVKSSKLGGARFELVWPRLETT